jgi:hypothetical protein
MVVRRTPIQISAGGNMARLVTVRPAGAAQASAAEDDALSRIGKYIPAEVLAFYALWTQAMAMLRWKELIIPGELLGGVIGLVFTYFYFDRFFPNEAKEARKAQKIISPLAFAVHAYTISAAAIPKDYFEPAIALALTALITLASAAYIPKKK